MFLERRNPCNLSFPRNPLTKAKKLLSLFTCQSVFLHSLVSLHLFLSCIFLCPFFFYLWSCNRLTFSPCRNCVFFDWPLSVSILLRRSLPTSCGRFSLFHYPLVEPCVLSLIPSSDRLTLIFRLSSGWPSVRIERQTFLIQDPYMDTHIHAIPICIPIINP